MNTLLLTDEMLRSAARTVDDAAQILLPEQEECIHEFSLGFLTFAEQLLHKTQRKATARKVLTRVAAACLAAVLCLSVWLAVDVRAREAVFSWTKENLVDRVVYLFQGKEPSTALPEYRPTWLPEGYELIQEEGNSNTKTVIYQKDDVVEDGFLFGYDYVFDGVVIEHLYNDAPHEISTLMVNGYQATLFKSLDDSVPSGLAWIDTDEQLAFVIQFYFDESIAVKIANSIVKVNG